MTPPDCDHLLKGSLVDEPDEAKVTAMHPEEECGACTERCSVVVGIGAVRSANFYQCRTALPEQIGDAEAATNFDSLTTGNDYFTTGSQCDQRKVDGCSIVVYRQRCLATREAGEQPF